MKRVAVYCGSSSAVPAVFKAAATELGACLAFKGITVVYGGARIGLMGDVADAALASGGDVIGVIPQALMLDEVVHKGLTRLEVVGSMHERKARMLELADGVVAMPGGLGTLEELFEALTWAQLRVHAKPIGLLNVNGYFETLLSFLDDSVSTGFLLEQNRALLLDATTTESLLNRLLNAF
ncbi:hypothetical protein KR52_10300 [Synechococcus sp. KORDI-52]|uniref:LOG family protein n=1 Tax=Synechococcus sp. KORDI-52 TaxID=585425 RepID=UPI0004E09877|nr:TIGR00730 family Rossman fold protein [Synechococcus sp. KORDI-52]AII49530.1 hypothetical protein KR52_10300 [Synechococcus sp. KORDI-52]